MSTSTASFTRVTSDDGVLVEDLAAEPGLRRHGLGDLRHLPGAQQHAGRVRQIPGELRSPSRGDRSLDAGVDLAAARRSADDVQLEQFAFFARMLERPIAVAPEHHALDQSLSRRRGRDAIALRQPCGDVFMLLGGPREGCCGVTERRGVDPRALSDAEGDQRGAVAAGNDQGFTDLAGKARRLERAASEAELAGHLAVDSDGHAQSLGVRSWV